MVCPVSCPLPATINVSARFQHVNSGGNRFGAVANFGCSGCSSHDLGTDGRRHFRARIVICNDHNVREPRRNFAHDRTLALVAIAAATEHANHPPCRERPERR